VIGELAALSTAIMWSFGSLCFTSAGTRIGALNVNRIRLVFAVLFLALALFISQGYLLQADIPLKNIYYLALSGLIGLVIGDSFLFSAMVILGTRLAMLVFSLSPIFAALYAWFYIGETLSLAAILGIIITISGVAWVTLESPHANNQTPKRLSIKGVVYALLGGIGQSVGLVYAKVGMGDIVTPMEGTFLRMLAAVIIIWVVSLFTGTFRKTIKALGNNKGVLFSMGGAFFGPFLGVWMTLVAVKHTQAGVVMAITSIVPVLVIPWVIIFYKEKVSLRALIGSLIAVTGVAILFLY